MKSFRNKKVVILGSGESARACSQLLHEARADVFCSTNERFPSGFKAFLKKEHILFEELGHDVRRMKDYELAVLSPGIKPSSEIVKQLLRQKKSLASEIQIAQTFQKGPWIAVTGTNGKTTTATLLHDILKQSREVDLCGNIGKSFSRSLLEGSPQDCRVVELSSFQLHFSQNLSPKVAMLLNLSANHLDWHQSLKEYYADKVSLGKAMKKNATWIVGSRQKKVQSLSKHIVARKVFFGSCSGEKSMFYQDGVMLWSHGRQVKEIADMKDFANCGEHYRDNILAASAAAYCSGALPAHIQNALNRLKPLKNRLENLGLVGGIRFVNDSKSTTEMSAVAAIQAQKDKVILVAGGRAKQRNFDRIAPQLKKHVARLVLYGESRNELAKHFKGTIPQIKIEAFESAVKKAYSIAKPGETVLLSPMCASFDQFKSYEERGKAFRRIVKELKRGN